MVADLSPRMGLGSAAPVIQPPRFVSKSSVESRKDPPYPPLTRRIFNTIDNIALTPLRNSAFIGEILQGGFLAKFHLKHIFIDEKKCF